MYRTYSTEIISGSLWTERPNRNIIGDTALDLDWRGSSDIVDRRS